MYREYGKARREIREGGTGWWGGFDREGGKDAKRPLMELDK